LDFIIVSVEDGWKFTHIRALKSDEPAVMGAALAF
jgi:hypothetical protein